MMTPDELLEKAQQSANPVKLILDEYTSLYAEHYAQEQCIDELTKEKR